MLLQAKESSILLSPTMLINCVSYICNPRENNFRSMHGIFPDSIQLNWMSPAPYKVSKRQPLNEQHLESKTISAILSTVCNWFEGHQITMNSGFNSRWIPPNSQCILCVISSWLNMTRGNYWFSPFMEVKANVNMIIWHAILWSLTFDYTNSNHDSNTLGVTKGFFSHNFLKDTLNANGEERAYKSMNYHPKTISWPSSNFLCLLSLLSLLLFLTKRSSSAGFYFSCFW